MGELPIFLFPYVLNRLPAIGIWETGAGLLGPRAKGSGLRDVKSLSESGPDEQSLIHAGTERRTDLTGL